MRETTVPSAAARPRWQPSTPRRKRPNDRLPTLSRMWIRRPSPSLSHAPSFLPYRAPRRQKETRREPPAQPLVRPQPQRPQPVYALPSSSGFPEAASTLGYGAFPLHLDSSSLAAPQPLPRVSSFERVPRGSQVWRGASQASLFNLRLAGDSCWQPSDLPLPSLLLPPSANCQRLSLGTAAGVLPAEKRRLHQLRPEQGSSSPTTNKKKLNRICRQAVFAARCRVCPTLFSSCVHNRFEAPSQIPLSPSTPSSLNSS